MKMINLVDKAQEALFEELNLSDSDKNKISKFRHLCVLSGFDIAYSSYDSLSNPENVLPILDKNSPSFDENFVISFCDFLRQLNSLVLKARNLIS
jgi:hypothetical protein